MLVKANIYIMIYALSALFVGFLAVLALSLIALARVGNFMAAQKNLDWEQVATITGDIGALKKSVQRLNNRINGMEAKDPTALLQSLAAQQMAVPIDDNVTQIRKGG